MSKPLRFVRNWLLLSIPVGILMGKFLKTRSTPLPRNGSGLQN